MAPSDPQTPMAESANSSVRPIGSFVRLAPSLAVLIVAAYLALTGVWMRDNGFFARHPRTDAAFMRVETIPMVEALRDYGLGGLAKAAAAHSHRSPPGIHISAALAAGLDGSWALSPETLWHSTAFYGFVLAFGTWFLARNFGGRGFAVLVVFLTMASPVVMSGLRPFYRQFPMAVWVPLILHCLILSRGLIRPLPAFVAGALTGVAGCFKELVPLYVGGAAVVALGFGLATRGRRLHAIGGAIAGLAGMIATTWWWYGAHWRMITDYAGRVTSDAGQSQYSAAVPLASIERWLYYPQNWIENGAGFFPSLLLVVGAAALLVRRSTAAAPAVVPAVAPAVSPAVAPSAPSFAPSAATLVGARIVDTTERRRAALLITAAPLLAVPVLTIGQAAAFSQYTMPFAPVAALALASVMRALPGKHGPRIGVAAAVVAALWQTCLGLRPLTEDRQTVTIGGIAVVDRVDRMLTTDSDALGLVPGADAEPWPVREFADLILRTSPMPAPRLALMTRIECEYCNPHHLAYEAWRLGGLIQLSPQMPVKALGRGPEAKPLLETVDFVVFNHRVAPDPKARAPKTPLTQDQLSAYLKESGLPLEIIACREPTPLVRVSLLRVLRPGWRPLVVERSTLEERSVVRVANRYDNGWSLLGYELDREQDGAHRVTTFWEPGQDADGSWTMTAGFAEPDKKGVPIIWKSRLTRPFAGIPEGKVLTMVSGPLRAKPEQVAADAIDVGLSRKNPEGGWQSPKLLAGSRLRIPLDPKSNDKPTSRR